MSGGFGGWIAGPVLAQQSDIVVIAKVVDIDALASGALEVRIQAVSALKGTPPPGPFSATLPASPFMKAMPASQADMLKRLPAGTSGLWCIKTLQDGTRQILPWAAGDYVWDDAFVTATEVSPSFAGTSFGQEILSVLVDRYDRVNSPGFDDDQRVLVSFDYSTREDATAVQNVMLASPKSSLHVLALISGIRMGADWAVAATAKEVEQLRSSSKFPLLLSALSTYYRPDGVESIAALQQLISLRTDLPGIDAAAGAALSRIKSKAVLPVMALLLDSLDPEAQLRAAGYFGNYAIFAAADGTIGSTIGPFSTTATKQNTPRSGAAQSAAEYAAFWKAWWTRNRATLGL